MNTVDNLLLQLFQNIKAIEPLISKKDKKILVSLTNQLVSGIFLTENQANLLVKILKENLNAVKTVLKDIELVINENLWSKKFRILKKVRKIYINEEFTDKFTVEFNFNTRLKEKITKLNAVIEGQLFSKETKYIFMLTESNIFNVVGAFIRENFEIDEKILDIYKNVEKIKKNTPNPFDIFSTSYEKLKKSVIDDIGSISSENLLLLQDRKIRYQYQITKKINDTSLAVEIANRPDRKIHINSQKKSFTELVQALIQLKRLPMLIVFEGQNSVKDKKTLELIKDTVSTLQLGTEIGIYFRYDKKDDPENFNQEIALLEYNKNLGSNTVVAGISNNKLPKFLVKSRWKPETVVTFTNNFKSNKTSVYCTDIDLVIYYTNEQPLGEKIHAPL